MILLGASLALSVAFFVYGLNTLHLTFRAGRYRPAHPARLSTKPDVAIHLPVYNELYVVQRLLTACAGVAASYGPDKVKVYVIDDSTDETSAKIDEVVRDHSSKGISFEVIRRGSREGFKAGALEAALKITEEKYVAVFDADFVPPPDFLEEPVAVLEGDPAVGFVQARWGHLDRNFNSVTESIAIGVDAHFLLEQQGRNASGYLMNFNGSAGVIRSEAIRMCGGWSPDTLAEDLDLSYRMQLAGYRGVYLRDLEVPAELPPTIASLKRQQGRWARGSLQTATKLLGPIRRSEKLTRTQKFQAGVHLTYYLVHPLMVASFLLAVAAVFLNINVISYAVSISIPNISGGSGSVGTALMTISVIPWVVFSVLVGASTLAVLFYCVQAVRYQRLGLLGKVRRVALLVVLGYGISISNSVYALKGIFSRKRGTFLRTPKYAVVHAGEEWRGKKYQIPVNSAALLEAGAVGIALASLASALRNGNLGILPILLVYLTGYSFVLYLSLRQTPGARARLDR